MAGIRGYLDYLLNLRIFYSNALERKTVAYREWNA